jgi:hypothetical protein
VPALIERAPRRPACALHGGRRGSRVHRPGDDPGGVVEERDAAMGDGDEAKPSSPDGVPQPSRTMERPSGREPSTVPAWPPRGGSLATRAWRTSARCRRGSNVVPVTSFTTATGGSRTRLLPAPSVRCEAAHGSRQLPGASRPEPLTPSAFATRRGCDLPHASLVPAPDVAATASRTPRGRPALVGPPEPAPAGDEPASGEPPQGDRERRAHALAPGPLLPVPASPAHAGPPPRALGRGGPQFHETGRGAPVLGASSHLEAVARQHSRPRRGGWSNSPGAMTRRPHGRPGRSP